MSPFNFSMINARSPCALDWPHENHRRFSNACRVRDRNLLRRLLQRMRSEMAQCRTAGLPGFTVKILRSIVRSPFASTVAGSLLSCGHVDPVYLLRGARLFICPGDLSLCEEANAVGKLMVTVWLPGSTATARANRACARLRIQPRSASPRSPRMRTYRRNRC